MIRPALLFLALLTAGAAAAQTGPPLGEALQALARERGLRLVYTGELVAGRRTACPASVRQSGRSSSAILACLLEGTGVDARRLPSGTIALYAVAAPRRPEPTTPPPAVSDAAPRTVALSGTVTDAATGEALIGAAVYAPALGRGATTNAYGFYSLPLPAGRVRLVTSYVGLEPDDTTVDLRADRRHDVALAADSSRLGEVVIEAGEDAAPAGAYASISVSGEDVQALPALLGEADVLKSLQLQPGVGSGAEGTSGLHVRGGSPDQTLVLLDGIPVYNASHLFGFLSTFNAEAVRRVELFKGGFPARYGGRLSSVVDVRMREGNENERRGHARVGLLSSQALSEGPLGDGAYLVAARRTYLDVLAFPVLAATGGIDGVTPTAAFYDLNAKANAPVSDRDRLYLSLYAGRDRFAATSRERTEGSGQIAWGNATGALRWTRTLGDRLFAATTLTASRYRFDVGVDAVAVGPDDVERPVRSRYESGIRDVALQTDLDWAPLPGHTVRFGGTVVRHRYTPGLFSYNPADPRIDTTLGGRPVGSWEGAVYAEDEVRVGRALLSAGLRASGYAVGGETYGALEPRLAARVDLGALAVRGSVARMSQYLHLLTTVGGIGLPADLWVPATERVPPEQAWQATVGAEGAAGPVRWSLDAYAKSMDGLVAYRSDAGLVRADGDWQDQVTTGSGRSVGVEAALSAAGPRTAAQLAYTWSRTDRQFDAIDGGARFPYRYDRTHDLGLAVRHRLSGRLDVSGAFVYQTGQAVTLPAVVYFAPDPGIDLSYDVLPTTGASSQTVYGYTARNGYRVPATHRLDVGLDLYFRRGPRPHALSFHVFNVYNRANAQYVEVGTRPDPETGEPRRVLVGKSLLPILPSLSYQFSF